MTPRSFAAAEDTRGEEAPTICGIREHIAPGTYLHYGRSGSLDIWGCTPCSLPRYESLHPNGGSDSWEAVIERFSTHLAQMPGEMKGFMLRAMVVMEPGPRCSAQGCYDQASALARAGSSDAGEDEPSTSRYTSEDGDSVGVNHLDGQRQKVRSEAPAPRSLPPASGQSERGRAQQRARRLRHTPGSTPSADKAVAAQAQSGS